MYNPVKVIEVFLWGRRVGALSHDYDRYSVFEYDPEFRKTGIEVAPFMMPLSRPLTASASARRSACSGKSRMS